jgi:hypothetical protein
MTKQIIITEGINYPKILPSKKNKQKNKKNIK